MKAEAVTMDGRPVIALDRLARTLVGPDGARTELPVLSLRLLDALAAASPAFIEATTLQQTVWPNTHITADALKQRVRLLRQSLKAVGYDPQLLDSSRGEGYALRGRLVELPYATSTLSPDAGRRRRILSGAVLTMALVLATALALVAALVLRSPPANTPSDIGPSPVRVGLWATPADPVARWLASTLDGTAHLLLVPSQGFSSVPSPCGVAAPLHLCLRVSADTDSAGRQTITLTQVSSSAVLLRSELRPEELDTRGASFALQASQFMVPGVLRWLGGRSGSGDRTFTQYREAVRTLGSCDSLARLDAMRGLREAAARAPNFKPGRTLLMFFEATTATANDDLAELARIVRDIEEVTVEEPELALAYASLAHILTHRGEARRAERAAARAIRLQPVLAGGGATCVENRKGRSAP